jgi:sec-independent protein translocase protein TatA
MNTILGFFGGLGGWEVLLIFLVILIFFGAKKLPDLARGLGKGIREFKDATTGIKNDLEEGINSDAK